MSSSSYTVSNVEADPKRPFKALGAFVVAFIVALIATVQGRTDLDTMGLKDWAIVVLGALATAITTYSIRNPKVVDGNEAA